MCIRTAVVDSSVAVEVRFSDHLSQVVVTHLLAERLHHLAHFFSPASGELNGQHHLAQLGGADVAVAVLVEDSERLLQLDFLLLRRLHPPRHHRHELVEINSSVTCTHKEPV